jgi:hypothetical protein
MNEMASLIEEGRVVTVNPFALDGENDPSAKRASYDVVCDFISVYGCIATELAVEASDTGQEVLLGYPLFLLEFPKTHHEYLRNVSCKTRNTIRKSVKQGYEFGEFIWNDHLEEIYEVNTSKEIRVGGPMTGWYTKKVEPRPEQGPGYAYYGAFKDGILRGYAHIVTAGDVAFVRHFMGHGAHLQNGIMNGLISHVVEAHAGATQPRWLKYGTPWSGPSASAFRRHAGFSEYAVLLDLAEDPELLERAQDAQWEPHRCVRWYMRRRLIATAC